MNDRVNLPEQFWDLLEQYREELRQQALAILKVRDDAEDVVQETFYEAFRNSARLARAKSLGAWLRSVNRRNALDRLRSRRRVQNSAPDDPVESIFTTGGFSALELRESIARAIGTIPENLRALVRLRFFEHQSCKQIAERLKLPEGTVKRLLYEASLRLFTQLKGELDSSRDRRSTPADSHTGEHPRTEGTRP